VRNAGKYDGRFGILCALVVLESLRGTRLPFAVELIGFSEEEGVRFATLISAAEPLSAGSTQR